MSSVCTLHTRGTFKRLVAKISWRATCIDNREVTAIGRGLVKATQAMLFVTIRRFCAIGLRADRRRATKKPEMQHNFAQFICLVRIKYVN